MAVILLIAGHETSANMIALGTLALLEHPEQLALLRGTDDPKVVAGAVEELLRYLTIAHTGQRRIALEDIEIGGEVIRGGDGIIVSSPPPTGTRRPSRSPTASICSATPASTTRSPSASTSAWASNSPAWNSRSSTARSTGACPRCDWPPRWRRSTSRKTRWRTASPRCRSPGSPYPLAPSP